MKIHDYAVPTAALDAARAQMRGSFTSAEIASAVQDHLLDAELPSGWTAYSFASEVANRTIQATRRSGAIIRTGARTWTAVVEVAPWGPRIPEPGRKPVTLSLGYGEALIVEKALRHHADSGVPNYAGMCNHLADMLAEQCAEIGRVSEERREESDP